MVSQIHKADCAHTFCHSGSLSHTNTYKYSSQHSVKEGGVGFERGGGIITWYFFRLIFLGAGSRCSCLSGMQNIRLD